MKISYISDLHLDFHVPFHKSQIKWKSRTVEFINKLITSDEGSKEVLIIAGDLSHFNKQSIWALEVFSQSYKKVFFTYGNHDLYLISNNQESKYKGISMNRTRELYELSSKVENVVPLFEGEVVEHKGVKFSGLPLWYPVETPEQKIFFENVSNDSKLIKKFRPNMFHSLHQSKYMQTLDKEVDVMITHFPVINIDTHFKYNSTACYLTPVQDIRVNHWVFGHSHEQKVYEKPYCNFYMNAIGYPEENLELSIKSFKIQARRRK